MNEDEKKKLEKRARKEVAAEFKRRKKKIKAQEKWERKVDRHNRKHGM